VKVVDVRIVHAGSSRVDRRDSQIALTQPDGVRATTLLAHREQKDHVAPERHQLRAVQGLTRPPAFHPVQSTLPRVAVGLMVAGLSAIMRGGKLCATAFIAAGSRNKSQNPIVPRNSPNAISVAKLHHQRSALCSRGLMKKSVQSQHVCATEGVAHLSEMKIGKGRKELRPVPVRDAARLHRGDRGKRGANRFKKS
jgi:hypothetical protein